MNNQYIYRNSSPYIWQPDIQDTAFEEHCIVLLKYVQSI